MNEEIELLKYEIKCREQAKEFVRVSLDVERKELPIIQLDREIKLLNNILNFIENNYKVNKNKEPSIGDIRIYEYETYKRLFKKGDKQ